MNTLYLIRHGENPAGTAFAANGSGPGPPGIKTATLTIILRLLGQ